MKNVETVKNETCQTSTFIKFAVPSVLNFFILLETIFSPLINFPRSKSTLSGLLFLYFTIYFPQVTVDISSFCYWNGIKSYIHKGYFFTYLYFDLLGSENLLPDKVSYKR